MLGMSQSDLFVLSHQRNFMQRMLHILIIRYNQVLQCGVHCALESIVSISVYQGLDQRYGVDSPKPSWVGISLSGVITQFWDCWDLSTKEKP